MRSTRANLRLVAIGTLAALAAVAGNPADAAGRRAGHRHAARKPALDAKLDAVLAEVRLLKDSLTAETAARQRLEGQLQQASTAAQSAQADARLAQARAAAAEARLSAPPVQTAQADSVSPGGPQTAARPGDGTRGGPGADGLYVKGIKITPGGFIELASVYRQHDTGNDISTGLNTIPFPQSRPGHADEFHFTPRQSRVSALVEGKPSHDVTLSMYGEFDFQGAAQSANSNETNSYNPRIRHLYGTIDWENLGLHLLAGQTFSLVTLDSKGITPRNEITPLTIDGQYHVGFTWTRQPMVRLVKDLFDKSVWLAVSAENPQTTFSGSVPAGVINTINNGQGYYAGATNTGAAATQSLNHVPDIVVKAAVEEDVAGHHVHGELYTLVRDFYEELGNFKTNNVTTVSFGGGVTAQAVPGLFDVQASGLTGKGVGRYGSGQLPDATFNVNGKIEPIQETLLLVGGIVHANPALDLWVFGGEEHDNRTAFGAIGYGNPLAVNAGCEIQGSPLACTGNTRLLEQISGGFWQKLYSGPWGQVRFGLQYSYVERNAFSGVGGAPTAHENMLYTSFRYYPF